MNKLFLLLYGTLFPLLLSGYPGARCHYEDDSSKTSTLSVLIQKNDQNADTTYRVEGIVWHNFLYNSCLDDTEWIHLQVKPGEIYTQSFSISGKTGRIKLYIQSVGNIFNYALIEPGDSVSLSINILNDGEFITRVSGRGSEKYNYYLHDLSGIREKINNLTRGRKIIDNPEVILKQTDTVLEEGITLLNQYSGEISENAYAVLKADLAGYIRKSRLRLLALGYAESTEAEKKRFEKAMRNELNRQLDTTDPEILFQSKDYVDYLYSKAKWELVYLHDRDFNELDLSFNSKFGFKGLYEKLKGGFSGILRDKLIAYSLVHTSDLNKLFDTFTDASYNLCLQDAVNTIETPYLKTLITRQWNSLGVGKVAYNFSLSDPEDKNVRLSDFYGKVVLLDFWSIGCSGCLDFKNEFEKELYPSLKGNSDFVFISINLNRHKAPWLNAIDRYSSWEYINLYTRGLDLEHPVVEHYRLQAVPTIILIDKQGKIVSFSSSPDGKALLRSIEAILD